MPIVYAAFVHGLDRFLGTQTDCHHNNPPVNVDDMPIVYAAFVHGLDRFLGTQTDCHHNNPPVNVDDMPIVHTAFVHGLDWVHRQTAITLTHLLMLII